jgi:hypothetical protein
MDPGCSPRWVLPAHPTDKITQAPIYLRPPCPPSGFPAPECLEAPAMPSKDGLRLNDPGHAKQAWPESGHPDQQRPVTAAQSKPRRCAPQGNAELMTKEQVLGLKPASRLEQVADEPSERVQNCKHRLRSCDDSASRHESQAGWNFRKGHPLNLIVWAKTNAGMGSLYRSQHELLPLFKKGTGPHTNNVELGKNWRSNLWTYPGASSVASESRKGLQHHPTVKPVATSGPSALTRITSPTTKRTSGIRPSLRPTV